MNKDQFMGRWRQMRGAIRSQWGRLTDDDLDRIGGDYDKMVGKIQELYGDKREDIDRRMDGFWRAA